MSKRSDRPLSVLARPARRAVAELLEGRTLMSAGSTVSGSVFVDRDGDGLRTAGQADRPGFTVFLDANGDGTFQSGEPITQTDAAGKFAFANVANGSYV